MKLRKALVLLGVAGLLVVPSALGAVTATGSVVASANGGAHWTIPLPNAFGVVVGNDLEFNARKYDDGSVSGHFNYHQTVEGVTVKFVGTVTCMNVYGNRAKIGGVITKSTDPTISEGTFGWFQVFDNGEGAGAPPDQSSLMGFGDEGANETFCNSPNLPRFGPWDIQGNIQVGQ
jgi:hypothetical protein